MEPGKRLRDLREQLGLTVRDVSSFSAEIAEKRHNRGFLVPVSRLFEIESKGVVPSPYRFYSLSVIYRRDIRLLLSWYGIDLNQAAIDSACITIPRSHIDDSAAFANWAVIPTAMEPGFDPLRTTNLGPAVREWGTVSLSYLDNFREARYSYGYIGTEDYTMHPILPPGSFVQIDQAKDKVVSGTWTSEYDRPIYFVQTRDGYRCCWCALQGGTLTLQPHPLSPERIRSVRFPHDADIVGQVIGVAMRLSGRSTKPKRQ